MSKYYVRNGVHYGTADDMIDLIEELEAKLAKADALAFAVERRMVDLGGFDNRFGLRKALEEYYRTTLTQLTGNPDGN